MSAQEWFQRYVELRRHDANVREADETMPAAAETDSPEHVRILRRFLEKHHKKLGPQERADEINGIRAACPLVGENHDFAAPVLAYESEAWCYLIDESDPTGYYRIPKTAKL
jgi:hypothetical protein